MAYNKKITARVPQTPFADTRIARVLWNDPGTGVMRHADAGYPEAIACAKEQGLKLPKACDLYRC